ncbi:MAG TPA: DUF4249 family protein [Cyclobacteriaceae bacterium]|nr:DUF4249 family protein [Cyclobacteriaceae bacterium]
MRTIIIFFVCMLCVACEESANIHLSTEETNLIVVEGIVTSENTNHLIKLSHTYQNINGIAEPVSGASIEITEGLNNYPLIESPAGSGEYYTPIMRAVTGKTYTITIQYQSKTYTAQDSPLPVEPLPTIQYYKTNNQYSLSLSNYGQDANFINHSISWKNTPACTSGICESKVVYYDLKTIDVNEIFKPKKEDLLFPVNSTIIRTKYSVSDAYKSYLRSMLSETEWHGGIFDVQRANVSTNLSEGAVGFFAVSTIVSDTTMVLE